MRYFKPDGNMVEDTRRPVNVTSPMPPVTGGYTATDWTPDQIDAYIRVRLGPTRELWYVSCIVFGIIGVGIWKEFELDLTAVLPVWGLACFVSYLFSWHSREKTSARYEKYNLVRHAKLTDALSQVATPRSTAPPVSITSRQFLPEELLEIQLRYILHRAYVFNRVSSPRGNETEIIPIANVVLDADLFKYLMYVLKNLGFAAGGGSGTKWRMIHPDLDTAQAKMTEARSRIRILDRRKIGEEAGFVYDDRT